MPLTVTSAAPPSVVETVPVGLWQFYAYFLQLGATGFGGPIALAGFMQRDLVEEKRWISAQDYLDGLALAQLAPGPLAAQLAMYLGYVRAGTIGATVVAVLFVLPSFLMVWGISAAYVRFGGLPWMQALFYGIGAAVIGIVARSAHKLTRLTLGRRAILWSIFAVMTVTTAWTGREIVWLFVLAGMVTAMASHPGIRKTMSSGMTVAALGVFLPVYLFVVIPAPYFRRHRSQPVIKAFVEGVSAAATGAIAGAGYVLATRALVDVRTVVIAVVSFLVLVRWKVSELWLIAAAAVLGLVIGHPTS